MAVSSIHWRSIGVLFSLWAQVVVHTLRRMAMHGCSRRCRCLPWWSAAVWPSSLLSLGNAAIWVFDLVVGTPHCIVLATALCSTSSLLFTSWFTSVQKKLHCSGSCLTEDPEGSGLAPPNGGPAAGFGQWKHALEVPSSSNPPPTEPVKIRLRTPTNNTYSVLLCAAWAFSEVSLLSSVCSFKMKPFFQFF